MNWLLSILRELNTLQVSLADVVDVLIVTLLLYALLVLPLSFFFRCASSF